MAAVYQAPNSMARVQGLPFAMAQSPTMYSRVIDDRPVSLQSHRGSPQPVARTYQPTPVAMPLQHRVASSQQQVFYAAPLPQKNTACMVRPVPTAPSAAKAPAAPSAAKAPAPPASSLTIGTRTFDRIRSLGSGSFGVVWEVTERSRESGHLLALKKSSPKDNKEMVEACLLEAEVLRELAQRLPATVVEQNFVPRYEAHCLLSNAGQTQVLLAMSKLSGRPLDRWLYGVDERMLNTMSIEAILDGPLPDGQRSTKSLEQACDFTLALMNQMTPIFEKLQTIAYHRDISAHNFLIDIEGQKPHFSVLDFGLAVRSSSWKSEWHGRNIAGDPRYFSPAAWMQLTHGFKYLENNPRTDWKQQYVGRLDHYSFGILVCELLFGLWQGPTEFEEEKAEKMPSATWRTNLEAARQAWRAYWATCVGLCQRFHSQGSRAVRHHLAGGHLDAVAEQMQALCASLAQAAQGCPGNAGDHPRARALLRAAAELIDPRSSIGWQELKLRMAELPEGSFDSGSSEAAEAAQANDEKRAAASGSSSSVPPQPEQPGQEETAEEPPPAPESEEPVQTAAVSASAAAGNKDEPSSPPPTLLNSSRRSQSEETRAASQAAKMGEAAPEAAEAPEAAAASNVTASWKPAPHRRNWTLDSPWALLRGVVQVGLCHAWRGGGGGPGAAEAALLLPEEEEAAQTA